MDKMYGKASLLSETMSSLWETVSLIVLHCPVVAEGQKWVMQKGQELRPRVPKVGSHQNA
jgi:hypothetical protein